MNDLKVSRSFLSALGIYTDIELSQKFVREFITGNPDRLSETDRAEVRAVLRGERFQHMVHAYVNGEYFLLMR